MIHFIDLHGETIVGQAHTDDGAATGFQCLFPGHIDMWPEGTRNCTLNPVVCGPALTTEPKHITCKIYRTLLIDLLIAFTQLGNKQICVFNNILIYLICCVTMFHTNTVQQQIL